MADGALRAQLVAVPIAETFWAQRFRMLTGKYGIPWKVNCEKPMEIKKPKARAKVKTKPA